MQHLFDKLEHYSESDIYPYHMPGHKRNNCNQLPKALYTIDITEIEGFDDLHQPEGILLDLQKNAAKLYGADESYYLVNGSSCGLLAALSAAVPFGEEILMARNCHKSVYHAAYLRQYKVTYLWPSIIEEFDIFDAIRPSQVEEALEKNSKIRAVIIVSPTYEGIISDVFEIAEVAHRHGIPLIVDEAHGAHLGLAPVVHENSCRLGADLVIHSVHKTLPSLTQTALLHVNGEYIDRAILKRFLRIYQTSSPSYLLMASIDNAMEYIRLQGAEAFSVFQSKFLEMLSKLKQCRILKFLPYPDKKQDIGKLVISVKNTGISGKELYDILLQKYHLQLEMAVHSYVLAMFTVNDTEEAYHRMSTALLEIDDMLCSGEWIFNNKVSSFPSTNSQEKQARADGDRLSLSEAWDCATEEICLDTAAGRISGEFVNLYPPGVPYLVPGETITKENISQIYQWMKQGFKVQGIIEKEADPYIKVVITKDGKFDKRYDRENE